MLAKVIKIQQIRVSVGYLLGAWYAKHEHLYWTIKQTPRTVLSWCIWINIALPVYIPFHYVFLGYWMLWPIFKPGNKPSSRSTAWQTSTNVWSHAHLKSNEAPIYAIKGPETASAKFPKVLFSWATKPEGCYCVLTPVRVKLNILTTMEKLSFYFFLKMIVFGLLWCVHFSLYGTSFEFLHVTHDSHGD